MVTDDPGGTTPRDCGEVEVYEREGSPSLGCGATGESAGTRKTGTLKRGPLGTKHYNKVKEE